MGRICAALGLTLLCAVSCFAAGSTADFASPFSPLALRRHFNGKPMSVAEPACLALRGGGEDGTVEPTSLTAEQVLQCDNLLGEAPMWNEKEGALYWLDINGQWLWKYAPGSHSESHKLPEVAGSFVFREKGGYLMGFQSGLCWYDPVTGVSEKIVGFEEGLNTRPNDAKCDREGNFVIGSYNNNHRQDKLNIGGLWRLNKHDLSFEEILDYRFRCSNTIAFNEAGDEMYFCDTPTREIFKFKYDPSGKPSEKTLFYKMTDSEEGGPDGATVDTEGGLWEAQAGNWRVVRHRPSDGKIDYVIPLPLNNPTSCCVGGENMDTLYITTARHRLSEEQRKEQPGAGQLWAVKLPDGLKGVPSTFFKG